MSTPYVNRREETQKLKDLLGQAKDDGPVIVFVSGEAGIGKTRLIQEFKEYAEKEGFQFLTSKCYGDRVGPYVPWRNAFNDYLKRTEEEQLTVDNQPHIWPEEEKESPHFFDTEKGAVFSESKRFINKIAEKTAFVVFIDNMQWSDHASLEFLHYLSDTISESPMMFIGAFRSESIDSSHPVQDLFYYLSRTENFHHLDLKPLEKEASSKLVQSLTDRNELDQNLYDFIYNKSKGNPFFIKGLVKKVLASGKLNLEGGVDMDELEELSLPSEIRALIEEKIKDLPDEVKSVLKMSSVVGEEVPYDILKEIYEKEEWELLDNLDVLIEHEILQEKEGEGGEVFIFSHGLLRDAVYQSMHKAKRKAIHKKTAKVLEQKSGEEIRSHLMEIAHHYKLAGLYSLAFEYHIQAAEQAEKKFAFQDAIKIYKRSLNILEELLATETYRLQIYEKLGDLNRRDGDYEKSRKYYHKAKTYVTNVDKEKASLNSQNFNKVSFLRRIHRKIAESWRDQGELRKGIQEINTALTLKENGIPSDKDELARIYSLSGWLLLEAGKYEEARKSFLAEEDLARDLDNEKAIAEAIHNEGTIMLEMGERDEGIKQIQEALNMREDIDDEEGLASSYNNLALAFSDLGELDKALEFLNKSLEIYKERDYKREEALVLTNKGSIYQTKGDFDKALNCYERSLGIKRDIEDYEGVIFNLNNMGDVYREMDDLQRAFDCHIEGLNLSERIGNRPVSFHLRCNLSQDYMMRDELDKARFYGETALEIASGLKSDKYISMAKRHLGRVLIEGGNLEKAKEYLVDAIGRARKIDDDRLLGRCLLTYTKLLKKKGVESYREPLKEAREIFSSKGMTPMTEKADNVLRKTE